MHEYIVTFWCDGDVSDIYVHANNEADAIDLASYGIEGYPEMITDVHTGKAHYIPRKGANKAFLSFLFREKYNSFNRPKQKLYLFKRSNFYESCRKNQRLLQRARV